jgi:uncharacterized small protein (DUF1192 family)
MQEIEALQAEIRRLRSELAAAKSGKPE